MVRRNELGFEQQHIEEKLNYSTKKFKMKLRICILI